MNQIFKLQPHRTMNLQGFDAYGAAAALWGASDSGFTVSGIFRDLADFAVLVLFEMDDPFGHPRFSYLPDGNFSGLVLNFDIEFQGIQAFESVKYPWTDWAYLDCQDQNGVGYRTSLKALAMGPTGRTGASGTFTLQGSSQGPGDQVTLCCLGQAFSSAGLGVTKASVDIPMSLQGGGSASCVQDMWWQSVASSTVQAMWWQGNAAYVHSVTISQISGPGSGSLVYSVQEDSLSSAQIAQQIANQINTSDPNCSATVGGQYGNEITITIKSGVTPTVGIQVSSSDGSASAYLAYLHWVRITANDPQEDHTYSVMQGSLTSAQIASNIASQVTASDPVCNATAGGSQGNEITFTLKAGVPHDVNAYVYSSDGSGYGGPLYGSTYTHSITIAGTTYSVVEDSLTIQGITDNLAGQINASDPNCSATSDTASGSSGGVTLTLKSGVNGLVAVTASDSFAGATLQVVTAAAVCAALASAINAYAWTPSYAIPTLTATASGNQITITAAPGADGNMITWGALAATSNLYFTPGTVPLAGGSSDNVSWHITVDFNTVIWTNTNTGAGVSGITSIQKLWLTFAPALCNGAAYAPTEWQVNITNWSVTDPNGVRPLKVAGSGSVRIEEDDPWVARAGYWEDPSIASPTVSGYWSMGRAIRSAYSATETRTLTIETHCQSTHNIYLGTRLDTNCGIISATLDGGAPVTLDCYAATPTTNQTRRLLFSAVAAGQHQVVITLTSNKNTNSSGWYFYFDFLECAVLSDVPDAPGTRTDVGLATDFDTDNTYKLSPQRLVWNLQKLGLVGEIDHYVGVFWWNQRKASGGNYPGATITLSGTWAAGGSLLVNLGGTVSNGNVTGGATISIPVETGDTLDTLAARLAHSINATLVGVWASASGATVTLTCQSTGANWMYSLIVWAISGGTIAVSDGVVATITGASSAYTSSDLETGAADPAWVIDPTITPALNRACRDWHTDYFAALKAADIGATVSFSQELVNPPDDPANGAVWVQRFPDGTAAETDTGFASLKSSMCAFGTAVQAYMAAAYIQMAQLMQGAGLTPRLQFGEVLWWYIAGASGMAFYDADTTAAAQAALGRALATFHTANDDPSINGYADANFLQARLATYVVAVQSTVLASVSAALFELLWPMDVNDPDSCRLLHYVNLPPAWQSRAGSGFDTFLSEGFQYAGVDHNLDKAARCAAYPFAELSWDRAHCRYLEGWYNPGWPWAREFRAAQRTGVPLIKFWAYDHLCLYGWPLPLPKQPSSPSFI